MGLLGIVLVGRFIQDFRAAERPSFDAVGFLLSAAMLGPTLFGLQLASRSGHASVALPLIAVGLVAALAYVAHARRTRAPILDVRLMAIPTFRLSVLGGSLIRITQGASPFLLPMLLQLAFGLSAAASGSITVATAIGAFAMKSGARRILRRFGFRTSLTAIGLLAPALFTVTGLFRPGWPWPVIWLVLLVYGFLTSLQFTAYNTIAYDEVSPDRLSAATSFYATCQQLSLSLGVCVAAGALTVAMRAHGHATPQFSDFTSAIWTVAAVVACRRIRQPALCPRGRGGTGRPRPLRHPASRVTDTPSECRAASSLPTSCRSRSACCSRRGP